MTRKLSGIGLALISGVVTILAWIVVWLLWFRGISAFWVAGWSLACFYAGGIIGAVVWSYLDDQRERREADELEAAETRQRALDPPVH